MSDSDIDDFVSELARTEPPLHALIESATPLALRSARRWAIGDALSALVALATSVLALRQAEFGGGPTGSNADLWEILRVGVLACLAWTAYAAGHARGRMRALRLAAAIRERLPLRSDATHTGDRRRVLG